MRSCSRLSDLTDDEKEKTQSKCRDVEGYEGSCDDCHTDKAKHTVVVRL